MVTRVKIQDKAVCISYSVNTLEKGMTPYICPHTKYFSSTETEMGVVRDLN